MRSQLSESEATARESARGHHAVRFYLNASLHDDHACPAHGLRAFACPFSIRVMYTGTFHKPYFERSPIPCVVLWEFVPANAAARKNSPNQSWSRNCARPRKIFGERLLRAQCREVGMIISVHLPALISPPCPGAALEEETQRAGGLRIRSSKESDIISGNDGAGSRHKGEGDRRGIPTKANTLVWRGGIARTAPTSRGVDPARCGIAHTLVPERCCLLSRRHWWAKRWESSLWHICRG